MRALAFSRAPIPRCCNGSQRARAARSTRSPALDASAAARATLALGDGIGRAATPETARIVNVLAFAETAGERIRV